MTDQTAAVVSILTAAAGLAFAKAPEIEPERIDGMVAEILKQADGGPERTQPDGAAVRKEVVARLQTFEVLKNEALKIGLDKDPEVRNRFKTVEAQFYASQYARHLEQTAEVSETELRRMYDSETRVIKLQQVSFDTADEARAAQGLLRKGLSFEELMKRYPNAEQKMDGFIPQRQLAPELAAIVGGMVRGEVTREPVKLQNKFYLFKISAVERNPEAQPFDSVRKQLERQAKQQKAQMQIDKILRDNGITPPQ